MILKIKRQYLILQKKKKNTTKKQTKENQALCKILFQSAENSDVKRKIVLSRIHSYQYTRTLCFFGLMILNNNRLQIKHFFN